MAKVLMIDSDATFVAKARESLEHRNHRVVSARTLGTAIDRLKRHQPDIIIVDLTGRNTLRYGPVRDPVKSVVECGVGDDVDTVIVDGKVVMEGAVIPGVDFAKLRADRTARGSGAQCGAIAAAGGGRCSFKLL